MIVGLDISTSVVGVALLNEDGTLVDLMPVDLTAINSDETWTKADAVRSVFLTISSKYNVTKVFIEENLSKFRPGFSSAHTLMTLARFNGIVSYIAYQIFNVSPTYINVNEARKLVGIKIDKKDKAKTTKEKVFEQVIKHITFAWHYRTVKAGKKKGQVVLEDYNYDMADAWVISYAGYKQQQLTKK